MFPEKRPPDIEKEKKPGGDGDYIGFPVCFARGHSVFVDFPDGQFARWANVCTFRGMYSMHSGHFLEIYPAGISCASRCFHITPILYLSDA
jgi:hypothetical protein